MHNACLLLPQEELQQARYAEHMMQQQLRDHQQQMAAVQRELDRAEKTKISLSDQVRCCIMVRWGWRHGLRRWVGERFVRSVILADGMWMTVVGPVMWACAHRWRRSRRACGSEWGS